MGWQNRVALDPRVTLFTGGDPTPTMAIGDLHEATAGDSTDVYYVDTGLYEIPEFNAVYILDTDRPALVETGIGTSVDLILDAMADLGIDPGDLAYILLTHVHLDHAGGAGYLAEECPGAEVCVHEIGARHVVDPDRLWQGTKAVVGDQIEYYAEPKPVPAARVTELEDGDGIDLGDRTLSVHHAPGHAPHQVVFHDPVSDGVFTADAAGNYTAGLDELHLETPPPDFDLELCLDTIESIRALDPGVLYYSHYGAHEADGLLDRYATVLEERIAEIERARTELDDDAVLEQFLEQADSEAWRDAVEAWGREKTRRKISLNTRGVLRYLDDRDD